MSPGSEARPPAPTGEMRSGGASAAGCPPGAVEGAPGSRARRSARGRCGERTLSGEGGERVEGGRGRRRVVETRGGSGGEPPSAAGSERDLSMRSPRWEGERLPRGKRSEGGARPQAAAAGRGARNVLGPRLTGGGQVSRRAGPRGVENSPTRPGRAHALVPGSGARLSRTEPQLPRSAGGGASGTGGPRPGWRWGPARVGRCWARWSARGPRSVSLASWALFGCS